MLNVQAALNAQSSRVYANKITAVQRASDLAKHSVKAEAPSLRRTVGSAKGHVSQLLAPALSGARFFGKEVTFLAIPNNTAAARKWPWNKPIQKQFIVCFLGWNPTQDFKLRKEKHINKHKHDVGHSNTEFNYT